MDDLRKLQIDAEKSVRNAPEPAFSAWGRLVAYLDDMGRELIQRCEKTLAEIVDLRESFRPVRSASA